MSEPVEMWELLVPTVKPNTNGTKFFKTKYHKVWDSFVRQITNGLTILTPVKGQWVNASNVLFEERMIPVRILATKSQIEQIIEFSLTYYDQEAILAYKVSSDVILKYRSEE